MTQTSLEPRELFVIERWKEVSLRRGSTFRNNFCHQSSSTDLKASDKTAMLLTDNCLLTLLSILVTFSNYRLSIHLAVDYNRKIVHFNCKTLFNFSYILTRTNASCFHKQIGHSPSWLLWISKVVHSTLPAFDRTVSLSKLPEQLKQLTCILTVITFLWDYKPENSILNCIYILGRYGGLTNQ